MTLSARVKNHPKTISEWEEFFTDEAIETLPKRHQRLIEDGLDEAETDEERIEIYKEVYSLLPKGKKAKKVTPSKTYEEILEEEMKHQTAMIQKIRDYEETLRKKSEDVPEIEFSVEFSRLGEEEAKEFKNLTAKIGFHLRKIEMTKIMRKSKSQNDEPLTRLTKFRTGEEIKVWVPPTKEEEKRGIEGFVTEYKNLGHSEATMKFGVKTESVMIHHDFKVKTDCLLKPPMRKDPIDECVGCNRAIVWDVQKKQYEKDEEGVYHKVKKDWGMIPCNHKRAEGAEVCKRHLRYPAEKWEKKMLNVRPEDIIRPTKIEEKPVEEKKKILKKKPKPSE